MDGGAAELFDDRIIARRRLRRFTLAAAAAVLLIRLVAELVPAMRVPDLALLDAWQSLRGTRRPSPQVAIVAIDEKSIQRFGPWAWPRSEYVPLVERLSKAGAKVIGFDFTFGTVEREAANNQSFAAAMEKAGNVVFGYEFTDVGDPSPPGHPASAAVQAQALKGAPTGALAPAPSLIEPEPVLAEAAAALGHVRTVVGDDGRIRVLQLLIQHGGAAYPSLAVQLARVYMGLSPDQVRATADTVGLGALDVPVSPSAEVLLNWPAGAARAFPVYSFLDVVRGDVKDDAFQGKAVLVAGTASGLDDRAYPFAAVAPGVLLHATFLDNLFRFDFVRAPVWAWLLEWGLLAAFLGLGVWQLPRLSTRALLTSVPLAALLLVGAAGFLFVQKGVWLQVVYPLFALVVPLAVVTALRLTASERETRDVAAEKQENQRLLGLSFQEKGMLDMALATFNKLPFTEDMKQVYLHLGLDYENRGHRDKAYLVYKKVFDADPRFEDVAVRMERLSQAGASGSLFGMPTGGIAGPTAVPFGTAVPQPTGKPVPTAVPRRTAVPHPTAVPEPTATPQATALPELARAMAASLPAMPAAAFEPSEAETALGQSARGADHVVSGAEATSLPTELAPAAAPTHHVPPTVVSAPTPLPGGPVMPGTRFGRYQVERHLGRGGMGDVYLVRDTIINRPAALKTIRPDTDLDPKQLIEVRQRFYREAQTAGKLNHPHIVTVYDVGEELGMSYIVMEFVEGQTLTQWMKKKRLSVPQIKHVIYHAGLGLSFAHENGVFHRDVKPDNIMLSTTGGVKVMDFGIARSVESHLTRTGSVMGTPAYMSPEQVNGQKVDGRSDVFSLGVILYELLTGRKPFKGDTMPSLWFAITKEEPLQASLIDSSVSTAWDAILKKVLAKNRDERYATVMEFISNVRDVAAR